jgi:hypothetical protein
MNNHHFYQIKTQASEAYLNCMILCWAEERAPRILNVKGSLQYVAATPLDPIKDTLA